MHAWRVLLALLLAHTVAEAEISFLDDGHANEEVFPLSSFDELLQIQDGVKNTPEQQALANTAQEVHAQKVEKQKKADAAETASNAATAQAQTASTKALTTGKPVDADTAVDAKQKAALAKDRHSQAKTELTSAQEKVEEAMKKARDAGATVNLQPTNPAANVQPAKPVVTPPATQAPAPTAAPSQLKTPPLNPKPDKLETILQDRRNSRLNKEALDLKKRYMEAKVEDEDAKSHLTQAITKLTKIRTKIAEAQSAKDAAEKEQADLQAQSQKVHREEHDARLEFEKVKNEKKKAKAMVNEAKVEVEVASSLADTGGGLEDLEKSNAKREEVDERLKQAQAEKSALALAAEKATATTEAAETAWKGKEKAVWETAKLLRKADGRFAEANYDIEQTKDDEMNAVENKNQAQAEADNAAKTLKINHALATAIALKVQAAANADEEQMKALLKDPQEAEKEAIKRVKDQDGYSEKGEPLIAADGEIANAYIQKFKEMPLPDSGRNPILEAEARAQLSGDDSEELRSISPQR